MSYDQLILVCLYRLFQQKEEAEFENLLEECFQQFPKKFVFPDHPWPDARKLDRPLRHLQERGLVFQDNTRFCLTKKGKAQGEKIIKKLYQEKLF